LCVFFKIAYQAAKVNKSSYSKKRAKKAKKRGNFFFFGTFFDFFVCDGLIPQRWEISSLEKAEKVVLTMQT